MAAQSAQQFIDDLVSRKTTVKLDELKDLPGAEIHQAILALGYDFSPEEVKVAILDNQSKLGVTITDDELASIAGGKGHLSPGATAGVAGGTAGAAGVAIGGGAAGIGVAAAASAASSAAAGIASTGVIEAGFLVAAEAFMAAACY